jgi:hypothetical protein
MLATEAAERAEMLARLVYELLDAHYDTDYLARGNGAEIDWDVHLDYLRNLQRLGREVLAQRVASSAEALPGEPSQTRSPVTPEISRIRYEDD